MRFFAWVMCLSVLWGGVERLFKVPTIELNLDNNSGAPATLKFNLSSYTRQRDTKRQMIHDKFVSNLCILELEDASRNRSQPNENFAHLAYSLFTGDTTYIPSDLNFYFFAERLVLVRYSCKGTQTKIDALSGDNLRHFTNQESSIHILPQEYLKRMRSKLDIKHCTKNECLVIYTGKSEDDEEYIGGINIIETIDISAIPEPIRSLIENDKSIQAYPNAELTPQNSSSVALWNAMKEAETEMRAPTELLRATEEERDRTRERKRSLPNIVADLKTLCDQSAFSSQIQNSYARGSKCTTTHRGDKDNLLSFTLKSNTFDVERDGDQITKIHITCEDLKEDACSKQFVRKVAHQAQVYPWMAWQTFLILLGSQNFMGFAFKICLGGLLTFFVWLFAPMTSIVFGVFYLFAWRIIDALFSEKADIKRACLMQYFSFLS